MTGESNCTLYVGNLDPSVTEELIRALFSQLGEVLSCKMFQEANTDPYCFVEFGDHSRALNAITMMNDKLLQTRRMRVDWATGQGNKTKANKIDTTRHYHVYVGELSPEIDEQALREAFQVFGEISDCKVVKDPQTYKSRGYGFVVFVKKYDAEVSIQNMNGQWLGRKMIKARWATRKLPSITQETKPEPSTLDYDEVFNQTTGTNTTVFCGGLKQDVTEEALQQAFHPYGPIDKIKIFKEKGYAFIKYTCKEHACQAIVVQHNSTLNGQTIRCSWGKDTGPEGQPPSATSPVLEHPSVVATPIPAASVMAGQPVAMSPAAAVAAAYANAAAAAAAGVPLGMQHMAAAVAGQPIVGTAPMTTAQYAALSAAAGHHQQQQLMAMQGQQLSAAGFHHQMAVAAAAPVSASAPSAVAPGQQVVGYWQYYPQHMSAAIAAQQQQQQQQQQHQQQQQQMMAMAAAAAAAGGHPSHHQGTPTIAYAAGHPVTAASSAYLPSHYYAAAPHPAAVAASPMSSPHYQSHMASPTSPAAPPPGYMWMYHPSWAAAAAGHPVMHPQ